MTGFTAPKTWGYEEEPSSADMNIHLRDNMSALWPYAAPGDMAVATDASNLQRLAIGANQRMTLKSLDGMPVWENPVRANITKAVGQVISNNSPTDITGMYLFDGYYLDPFNMLSGGDFVIPDKCDGFYKFGGGGYWQGDLTNPGRIRQVTISVYHSSGAFVRSFSQTTTGDTEGQAIHQEVTAGFPLWANYSIRLSVLQRSGVSLTFYSPFMWIERAS